MVLCLESRLKDYSEMENFLKEKKETQQLVMVASGHLWEQGVWARKGKYFTSRK